MPPIALMLPLWDAPATGERWSVMQPVVAANETGEPPPTATPAPDAPTPPPPPADWRVRVDPAVLAEILEGRRRPGYQPGLPEAVTQDNPGALRAPPPTAFPTDSLPIPDRWRLITAFCPTQDVFVALRDVCRPQMDEPPVQIEQRVGIGVLRLHIRRHRVRLQ